MRFSGNCFSVASLRKPDVFSIVTDRTRSEIVKRLDETGKAAYSDLLDSAEHVRHLSSTGNFNYHLHFLLESSVITKDGVVYKLTEKGREIARFLKDIDLAWNRLEPILRGEKMSITSWAEQFAEETGTKMQKTISRFHGIELISDERKVIGIIAQEDCRGEFFKDYQELSVEKCRLSVKRYDKKEMKCAELVIGHPDLQYYVSPQRLSTVYEFLSTHFKEAHIYGVRKKPYPFLFRAKELGTHYDGCAFLVAPVVF